VTVCPRCSTSLDASVQGLCPRCLLDIALGEDDELDDARFRIVTLLGKGPNGTTYLAEQDDQPRFVSLKVLEGRAIDRARMNLAQVRRTLAECRYPSLVSLVSVVMDPTPAVAAAYVAGRRISADSSQPIAGLRDVAAALAYLHERRVIHGNVKTTNVLALPADGPSSPPRWCLIDLAGAAPLNTPADAAIDIAAFGVLMEGVVGTDHPATSIAMRAKEGGYRAIADVARDLVY
jgi:serine/threonine protein kinase